MEPKLDLFYILKDLYLPLFPFLCNSAKHAKAVSYQERQTNVGIQAALFLVPLCAINCVQVRYFVLSPRLGYDRRKYYQEERFKQASLFCRRLYLSTNKLHKSRASKFSGRRCSCLAERSHSWNIYEWRQGRRSHLARYQDLNKPT